MLCQALTIYLNFHRDFTVQSFLTHLNFKLDYLDIGKKSLGSSLLGSSCLIQKLYLIFIFSTF